MNRHYFGWIIFFTLLSAGIVSILMWKGELRHSDTGTIPQAHKSHFSPFSSYISAVGIVEARSGNIYIGSPVDRVVEEVEVSVGQKVKAGEVLFRLEAADLTAAVASRRVEYANSRAEVEKLQALPRKEDVAVARASLKSTRLAVEQAESQYQRVSGLQRCGAMSLEEVLRRRFAYEESLAKWQEARAHFSKVKGGTWPPDLMIARLRVKEARAALRQAQADFARTVIRAPIDATVLQVKIHAGEFPPADSSRTPPMIIGDIDTLHLRVSINQFDASYYDRGAPAVAYLQGNSQLRFPLTFVEVEPYFVMKQNLNNDITETVDTRVLQAIYCFEEGESRIFVGQQMDVFIETKVQ